MGQTGGTATSSDEVTKAEYFVSNVLGDIAEDDYYCRSAKVLDNFKVTDSNSEKFDNINVMQLDESFKMIEPGYMELENGYLRCEDGGWYIACLTDLGEYVNGEMFDWWFRNCDNDEKYRWWHPRDHVKGTWDPSFYAAMPHERKKNHYVGHTHIVQECIGGEMMSLHIEFQRASKFFDVTSFEEKNITACLVARVYIDDPMVGRLAVGYLIHMVREQYGKSELRSRFWIGYDVQLMEPEDENNSEWFSAVVNYVSGTKWFKQLRLPRSTARGLWIHCAQEMQCLREFLPHYYSLSVDQSDALKKKLWSSSDDQYIQLHGISLDTDVDN